MCTVKSSLAHCEFVQAFLIFSGKMLTEFNEGLLGNGAYMPGIAGSGENASGLKHEKGEVFDSIVG